MELRQLRYFAAVAQHKSFTLAARELHIAQPALSQQVRRLEQELGVELLRRTTRRVELSEAGELALARATRALAEADALRAEVDALRGLVRGTLSVGMLPAVGRLEPAELLAAFGAAYPAIEVRLVEDTLIEALALLRADRLDLAFGLVTPDEAGEGIAGEQLFEEELVVIVARDHPLARRRSVRFSQLDGEPLVAFLRGSAVRQRLDAELQAAGVARAPAFESNNLGTVRALVANGLGVSLTPRSFALAEGPPIALLRVAPRTLRVPVSILYRADRTRPPAAEAFLKTVRDALTPGHAGSVKVRRSGPETGGSS
ncbi:MAG: LysR family transcriptional regulator [Thermoleophilaceae bacterium]